MSKYHPVAQLSTIYCGRLAIAVSVALQIEPAQIIFQIVVSAK
jgi:hypothetical protein